MSTNAWKSERLVYRAVEKSDDDFIQDVASYPDSAMKAMHFLPVPSGTAGAVSTREHLEKCFMSAIVCLPAPDPIPGASESEKPKPIPIGFVCLGTPHAKAIHHRNYSFGISIHDDYQNKGYGSEAVRWTLDWAFRRANAHRVWLGSYEYNPRALHVYEKIGFTLEGTEREAIWHDGRYWNALTFGILEHEWREKQKKSTGAAS